MSEPDREDAPLLHDPERDSDEYDPPRKTFGERLSDIVNEPLTTLTKILLVFALLMLLLTAIFIGLFAGAEHKLSQEHNRNQRKGTATSTLTFTSTSTSRATTTVFASGTTTLTGPTNTVTTTLVPPTTGPNPPLPTGPDSNLCTTPNCVMVAANILRSMDTSKDPCEDFYEFTNGGWLARTQIPPGKGAYGTFNAVSDENKRIIRRILESDDADTSSLDRYDKESITKLRDMYASCMNEDLLNDRGDKPLRDIVRVIRDLYRADSWKKSDDEARTEFGLTAAISFMHSRGIDGLFDFDIDGDVGVDPDFMTLWFSQPSLGLPSKEYFAEEDIVELYQGTLTKIIEALADKSEELSPDLAEETEEKEKAWPPWPWPPWGDDDHDDHGHGHHSKNETEKALDLANQVVKFEKRIANASLDLEVLLQDPIATYNPTMFHKFANTLPQIDFPIYFATFTPRNFPTRVILTSTTYAASLSEILSETSKEVVEAYLVTRAALSLSSSLGHETDVWKAVRNMQETLQGIKKGQVPDRSEWCIQKVEDTLGFAAGRFFVEEAFPGDSKQKGTKVITDIIGAFKESLRNLKWMDDKSAKAAAEKADAIRVKVGYPLSPNTESSRSIASYYRLVFVDKAEFFESVLSSEISEVFKKWQTLGKTRDENAWLMYPSMVNAYFNPPANEIVFPAGILQPPFFSANWPAYLQYGAFGAVAAHELTHAFDSAGRLYNQHGKLEQWWTNETSEGFNEIQSCISEQYSKFAVDDGKGGKVHVNGNLTSGENIGDSGLLQAYRAWRGQYHTEPFLADGSLSNPLLPGLNFTQEQLFFIGFGQIWAQNIKPAAAVQRIRTDPHSPNQFRVEGTLSNVPEFAAAFQCKKGAKLNPPKEKRCELWSSS